MKILERWFLSKTGKNSKHSYLSVTCVLKRKHRKTSGSTLTLVRLGKINNINTDTRTMEEGFEYIFTINSQLVWSKSGQLL